MKIRFLFLQLLVLFFLVGTASADLPGTCKGENGKTYCGSKSQASSCYCDNVCASYGDCCTDYKEVCNALTGTCKDSDGGQNFYTNGIVTTGVNEGGFSDFCLDSNQLIEYYCSGNEVNKIDYKCQTGCKDGACVTCGNGKCEDGEAGGCPPVGEGPCWIGTCPKDCEKPVCGNGVCELEESNQCLPCNAPEGAGCPAVCEINPSYCPKDCGTCGNGICEFNEKICQKICPSCPAGKDYCPPCSETCSYTCPQDCQQKECLKDSDCPQIVCIKAPCPKNTCINGQCVLSTCGNNICEEGEKKCVTTCPECLPGYEKPCLPCSETCEYTCPSDCPGTGEVSETVWCAFSGSTTTQKCASAKGGCSGTTSCQAKVTGKKGEQIKWESSCTGTYISTIDGQDEKAVFTCASNQITKQDVISWINSNCYNTPTPVTDAITGAAIKKAPIIIN